jgi:hypothetical protein
MFMGLTTTRSLEVKQHTKIIIIKKIKDRVDKGVI